MIDPQWEAIHKARQWGQAPAEGLILFLARYYYFSPRSELKILEIGCGAGANLWYLSREGYQIYGIDGSESAIKRAGELLADRSPGWKGEINVGDIADIPYPDEHFDAVVDVEAISGNVSEDAMRIYAECYRVLKPGAFMYSQTFSEGTDERAMAEGTYNRFSTREEMQVLTRQFDTVRFEHISGARQDIGAEVAEWLITLQKPA